MRGRDGWQSDVRRGGPEYRGPYLLRASGQEIAIERDYTILGREPSACHILLEDDVVSRRHAALELDASGSITVVDLASANGTFVNGLRVVRHVLGDGDRVGFGPGGEVELVYRAGVLGAVAPDHSAGETGAGRRLTPPLPSAPTFTPQVTFAGPSDPSSARLAPETVRLDGLTEKSFMQKVCATCSAALDHDATFCPSCSAPVSMLPEIVCPQCGKSISANSKFCKYCAFNLAGAGVHTAEPPPPYGAPAVPPRAAGAQLFNAPPPITAATFVEAGPTGGGASQPGAGGVPFEAAPPPAAFNVPSTFDTSSPFNQPPAHVGPPPPAFNAPTSPYAPAFSIEASASAGQPSAFGSTTPSGSAAPYGVAPTAQAPASAGANADKGSLITSAGAAIVVICLFLPWVQFSCGGYVRTVSGAQVANSDGSLWVVFGEEFKLPLLGDMAMNLADRQGAGGPPSLGRRAT